MADPQEAIKAVIAAYKAYTKQTLTPTEQRILNQRKEQERVKAEAEKLRKEREAAKPYRPG